jgi:hypothetical protein
MSSLWILRIAFGFIAIPFLMIGLRGVVTKRPFLISLRHFVWLMSIPILLSVTAFGEVIFDEPFSDGPLIALNDGFKFVGIILLIVFLLPFGIAFFVMWKQVAGYSAFGVTDESFQDALHSALNKLNLPFEETIFSIRLTSIGADLQVSVQSSMGVGQLSIKQSEHRPILNNIANVMNEYFKTTSGKSKMTASICYIVVGALVIIAQFIEAYVDSGG